MNLDFGRISVNVYFMLCCPTKLLALIKNLSLKISRDLCVPTWYIGLAGFRKDCLCCQWHRKQHVNIAGGWLLLCVALWFVVFFFLRAEKLSPWTFKCQLKLPGHATTDAQWIWHWTL